MKKVIIYAIIIAFFAAIAFLSVGCSSPWVSHNQSTDIQPTTNQSVVVETTPPTTNSHHQKYKLYGGWSEVDFYCNGTIGVYVGASGAVGGGGVAIMPNDPNCPQQ